MYTFIVRLDIGEQCSAEHVIREYARPRHVTRFLLESSGPLKYSVQVLLHNSPVIVVSSDSWLHETICDQHDPQKTTTWQEYWQKVMRSQAWYERNKRSYARIRSAKEDTDERP